MYVNNLDSFQARNINIFTNYVLTFFNTDLIQKWKNSCNMTFYQNQLNFAVWCATSGCGVSNEHLNNKENLLSSLFKFHIYYQTRKILEEMSCPIPGESFFNFTNNNINMVKFQKLCNEFDVNPNTDFRFKGGENGGLGTMYNYISYTGYEALSGYIYDSNKFKFIPNSTNQAIKIDYIKQDAAAEGWKQFILESSIGFTKSGIVRIDDSIRTYAYCILGSQAQTRSNILNSIETQQNFVDLLEQNIKSMFSIPESIDKYQSSVNKTNSKINYAIGIGLYMIPSDLLLQMGRLENYNNSIIVADKNIKIGLNETLNHESRSVLPIIPVHQELPKTAVNLNVNNMYFGIGISVFVFMIFYSLS